jgi:hypothetical protein
MLPNQVPEPPIDMVMPPVYGHLLIVNFAVLAVVMVWILKEAGRTRSFTPILIVVGAAVASITESIWDVLGAVWYPQFGHTPLYRFFNICVPIWVLPAYAFYLGGQGYWVYRKLVKGMTRAQFWKFYAFVWGTNVLIEIPALRMGVYVYHGPQPLMLFGFPLTQAMGNALMPILIGTMVFAWREFFVGARSLLIIPAVPIAMVTALGGVEWPMFLAVNSGRGYETTYPAAIVTLALSLMVAYMVNVKVCQPEAARIRNSLVSELS